MNFDITTDISSLTDFKRNTLEHLEHLKKSGRPEVLTVNGQPEVVVQDVDSYQQLLDKANYVDTVTAIQAGMEAHKQGQGIDMRKSIESLAAKHGIELKKR